MNAFNFLTSNRRKTPGTGLTMMLDKGIGLMSLIDLSEISGDYMDLQNLVGEPQLCIKGILYKKKRKYIYPMM